MTPNRTPVGWRQIAAATQCLGATALGFAAAADAQPNTGGGGSGEWDIGVYDSCMQHHPPFYSDDDKLDWAINCCRLIFIVFDRVAGFRPVRSGAKPD